MLASSPLRPKINLEGFGEKELVMYVVSHLVLSLIVMIDIAHVLWNGVV